MDWIKDLAALLCAGAAIYVTCALIAAVLT